MRIVVVGGSGRVGTKLVETQFFDAGQERFACSHCGSHARYFGAKLGEDTLTPDEGAIIGVGCFDDWLKQVGGERAMN